MRCCILFVAPPLSQIVADSIMTAAFFDIQHGLILGVICFVGMGHSGGYLAALVPVGVIASTGLVWC
tara:strand:+ start:101 stop:301 length:201 start_codon:yes stop_codon:yes gene_type:complete